VQPHSGSQANASAYAAVLQVGDTILGLDLAHGGHLTHGHKLSFSGKLYRPTFYGVRRDTELIDYDQMEEVAERERPKVIIGGGSAYPRLWDFARMRQIADKVGAVYIFDMAHIAGLVAGGVHPSPVPHAHITTTTTHKTLRGPRSGLILCGRGAGHGRGQGSLPRPAGRSAGAHRGGQGGGLGEALRPEFKTYAAQIVANAKVLAASFAGGWLPHRLRRHR
jgi:glycine hydroxymethyltransferase